VNLPERLPGFRIWEVDVFDSPPCIMAVSFNGDYYGLIGIFDETEDKMVYGLYLLEPDKEGDPVLVWQYPHSPTFAEVGNDITQHIQHRKEIDNVMEGNP